MTLDQGAGTSVWEFGYGISIAVRLTEESAFRSVSTYQPGMPQTWNLKGKRITGLYLAPSTPGNVNRKRVGGIKIETEDGEIFEVQSSETLDASWVAVPDVGSGVLVGLYGRAGADVDKLGFIFFKPIENVLVTISGYPDLASYGDDGIQPETVDQYTDRNDDDAPRNWEFSGSTERTISREFTLKAGLEIYAEVTVKGGIPLIAEFEAKAGWKLSVETSFTRTESQTKTLTWKQSGVLQPGDKINLIVITLKGNISLRYESEMWIKFVHLAAAVRIGSYSGQYKSVEYTSVSVSSDDGAEELAAVARAIGPG